MPYSILCLSDCNILQYVEYGVSSKEKNIIMFCIIIKSKTRSDYQSSLWQNSPYVCTAYIHGIQDRIHKVRFLSVHIVQHADQK